MSALPPLGIPDSLSVPSLAVVGAGAVGCYFGGMFARAGAAVTLIGRPDHVAALSQDGLFLDGLRVKERIVVSASTEIAAVADAAIILLCVKTLDTESAAVALAPHLAPGALVVSLQNGTENAERIRAVAGISVLPAVVFVGAQMDGPGQVKHTGRGDLLVGWPGGEVPNPAPKFSAQQFATLAEQSGIPCKISADIAADLWIKLIMNCAYNAISALGHVNYGQMLSHPEGKALMEQVIAEAIAVAAAAGIALSPKQVNRAVFSLGEGAPGIVSSTAQDIRRGKHTEIDALNGYLVRRGRQLGVPVPANQSLLALIKLLEESLS